MNLIGEHVDYNDGLVLPFAIDRTVLVAWSQSDARELRAYSLDYAEPASFSVGALSSSRSAGFQTARAGESARTRDASRPHDVRAASPTTWSTYVEGVARMFVAGGHPIAGIDLAIAGDIPQGAGLSSSAALEVAVAGALRDAFALPITDIDLALLCHRAENEFVGVQSGIMDQFASALCHEDHALLIDCRSLEHRDVPLRLAEHGLAIVIANSGVQRELVASAYNERRQECEQAVVDLKRILDRPALASLRDVTLADIESLDITGARNNTPLRRARHVVSEIARVACAVEALERSDFDELGRLMRESHQSLRDDYDVSSPELDLLCALADAQDYVLGARLTGAGFGGCTVSLLRADAVDAFDRDVIAPYRAQSLLPAEAYTTAPRRGLRTWRL